MDVADLFFIVGKQHFPYILQKAYDELGIFRAQILCGLQDPKALTRICALVI